jgi:hypothetical protein
MSWLPQLGAWQYAMAGAVCALGPVVIHLLSRRRHRQVHWGAMQLLREAMVSQRRLTRLRNLLLLLLRVAAVFLFGLALARPFSSRGSVPLDADTPRHLILLVDNSLSMSYRSVDRTLFERAQQTGEQLIDSLPVGSLVSVLPLCKEIGQLGQIAVDPEQAVDVLRTMRVVDDVCRFEQLVAAASRAAGQADSLQDQIVVLSDLQRATWDPDLDTQRLTKLPALHIYDVLGEQPANTWVEDVRLSDQVVSPNSDAAVVGVIAHDGHQDRTVQVSLMLDGNVVASRSLQLSTTSNRKQVTFQIRTDKLPVPRGGVRFIDVCLQIDHDRLPDDDARHLVVPVVNRLPVVFVDQYGDGQERVRQGLVGETWPLRQLLAPSQVGGHESPRMIEPRHLTVGSLNRSKLEVARLIVIAGVANPMDQVGLLRDFVAQGGTLFLAMGGSFDPVVWSRKAWLDGSGILPAPLDNVPKDIGSDADRDTLSAWRIASDGISSSSILRLPGIADDDLRRLYAEPIFFKWIDVLIDADSKAKVIDAEGKLIADLIREDTEPTSSGVAGVRIPVDEDGWVAWQPPRPISLSAESESVALDDEIQQLARLAAPVVHARMGNAEGSPLLVERRIGQGRVVFFASGFLPQWTNLSQTNAIVMLDRIVRDLIFGTLPTRNFAAQPQIAFGLPGVARGRSVLLQRPGKGSTRDSLEVTYVGRQQTGVLIRDAYQRGIYRLGLSAASFGEATSAGEVGVEDASANEGHWRIAVNGNPAESDLTPLRADEKAQLAATSQLVWFDGQGSTWRMADGPEVTSWWRPLVVAVLIVLLVELTILAWSSRQTMPVG